MAVARSWGCEDAVERLDLVAAIAILYATTQGMAVQIVGF